MTRVVILSGFRIFPANNGAQVRTSGVARALARMGYEVLIYSLAGRAEDYLPGRKTKYRRDPVERGLFEETHLGLDFGLLQTITRRLQHPRYLQYRLLAAGYVPRRCAAALRDADVIISDMSFVPRVPGPWATTPWYMLSHNLEHRLLAQEAPVRQRFAPWMKRVEAAAPSSYDDIFTVAAEDHDFFRANEPTGTRALPLITCAVDPIAYQAAAGSRARIRSDLGLGPDDRLIVFSGSAFGPNLEALERLKAFTRRASEFLARERIHFVVVGSIAAEASRTGALIVTGRVPDVVPYLAAADAGLNPITQGSGANVKLFEYLAACLPVISTAFGVRGTALESGRDYLELDPENFADAVTRFADGGDAAYWRHHAQDVWSRHRHACDINELVRKVVGNLPGFPRP